MQATIHQPYSMVFQYISWRELEPAENDFRFDEWEKSWKVEAATGQAHHLSGLC
jgi:hypothetical protein